MKYEEWLKTDEGIAGNCYRILSRPVDAAKLAEAIAAGLIPKKDLVDGARYFGHCRNASEAVWHADRQRFEYQRTKFGSTFPEDIVHPEDDEGFDIFTAVKRIDT